MEEFDFSVLVNRRNTNSYKWNVAEGEIPLWVADMDFPTAPAVRKAMERRAAHGVFGYADVPDEWYGAYCGWWQRRHGFALQPEWLNFTSGAVPPLSSLVRRLTLPAEKVLIQTPVYNIFFNSVVNNGRVVEEAPLTYSEGSYSIDFADLEQCLADPQVTMMVLCNPHNPVGRIWSAEELAKVAELCARHGVVVVSDEVHCDLTAPGTSYIPFASVSETCRMNSVSLMAPSKAFNIAGIQTSAVCVPNEHLRTRVVRGLNNDEVAEPNAFAVDAAVAAFNEGAEWLDALRGYLWENRAYMEQRLGQVPGVSVVHGEATYLLWVDCRGLVKGAHSLCREIREKAGVVLSNGRSYGAAGEGFLRINLACPRSLLEEAVERMLPVLRSRD